MGEVGEGGVILVAIAVIITMTGMAYMRLAPYSHIFENLVHSWYNRLRRVSRCGFVG